MSKFGRSIVLGLALITLSGSIAFAQQQKDVTDGFFDIPAKEDPDGGKGNSVPGYLITAMLGAGAMFAMCKTARR